MYGHTHKEDIQVVQSVIDGKNIGINFYAGSLTSYYHKNPSFNVIEFDAQYMIPVNIKTYYFDLVKANSEGTPTWLQLHDYVSYYSMPDLRPDNIFQYALKVKTDEPTATLYKWNRTRQVRTRPSACNEQCRTELYCLITTSETL